MELVSIFLLAQMSKYYFPSFHSQVNHFHKSIANAPAKDPNQNKTDNNSNSHQPQQQNNQKSTNTITNGNSNLKSSNTNNYNYNYSYKSQPAANTAIHNSTAPTIANSINNNNNKNIITQQHLTTSTTTSNNLVPTYRCEFVQPVSLISFKERVKLNKVHLETCSVTSGCGNISIACTIRVFNQSYEKSVIVRYTTDEWHTFRDVPSSYKPGSCDGWSDKFTATFSVGNQLKQFQTGQRIIFAIKLTYDGDRIHWDNNGGLNYTVKKV